MKKVALIGNGWIGKAMLNLFPEAYVYTRTQGDKEIVNTCDVAFIAVPTPSINEGILDTSEIDKILEWCECDLIVIRSTVNPGDTDRWTGKYGKSIVFQPEYLGESPAHPLLDEKNRSFLVIGGVIQDRRKLIDLYQRVYNANIRIRQMTAYEAEIVKLSENRAIAFKVAQCQELYDVCEMSGADYYNIREAVFGDDPRMDLWWTFVYEGNRGFSSKCIPKDIYAWKAWAQSVGYDPKITKAILEKNKEWIR